SRQRQRCGRGTRVASRRSGRAGVPLRRESPPPPVASSPALEVWAACHAASAPTTLERLTLHPSPRRKVVPPSAGEPVLELHEVHCRGGGLHLQLAAHEGRHSIQLVAH